MSNSIIHIHAREPVIHVEKTLLMLEREEPIRAEVLHSIMHNFNFYVSEHIKYELTPEFRSPNDSLIQMRYKAAMKKLTNRENQKAEEAMIQAFKQLSVPNRK